VTLFRRGGKRLHYFVANLFWILWLLHTQFYQNRPSFVEDVTKIFWLTFFLATVYNKEENDFQCLKFIR